MRRPLDTITIVLTAIYVIVSAVYIHSLRQRHNEGCVTVVEKTVIVHDTLEIPVPVEVIRERRTVDTVYVTANEDGKAAVPISEYHFREEGKYDIKATGYNVTLGTMYLYPETRYTTLYETIEKTVEVNRWDAYLGAYLGHFEDRMIPSVALTVKSPKKWLLGANIGMYRGALTYGATIQYKFTHNN